MAEKESDGQLRFEKAIATSSRAEAIREVRGTAAEVYDGATQLQRDVSKLRTSKALGWSRERIMRETGWQLTRFLKAERQMMDDELRYWQQTRPEVCFSDYKNKIELMVSELGDVMSDLAVARNNPQVFVSSIKVRGDLLNKMIEKGQEFGILTRVAKKIEFDAKIDVTQSVHEIQVQIQTELQKVNDLLEDPAERVLSPAGSALMKRLDPRQRVIDAEAAEVPPAQKRLAEKKSTE